MADLHLECMTLCADLFAWMSQNCISKNMHYLHVMLPLQAAGSIIERKYPHIKWVPCAAHCLDLSLEDISKLSWCGEVISQAKSMVGFITRHEWSLALYREHASSKDGQGLQLLKPGRIEAWAQSQCHQHVMLVCYCQP